MSYDLHIIPARPGLTPEEVNAGFERMEAGLAWPFGEPGDALRACLADIFRLFPPMSEQTDDQIEDSIWSVDPDWVDGFLALCMRWSITPEQVNQIIAVAHRHGFAVHDPQEDRVLSPPAASGGWRGMFRRLFGTAQP